MSFFSDCEFCQHTEEYLKITKEYLDSATGDRPKIVWINELALKLDCYKETIQDWAKKEKKGKLEHPEFARLVKKLESIQELRLQQRLVSRNNPVGAIFLLKTKHKYIETEKQIMAGDDKQPLEIRIVEDLNH